jgi:Asp-tRNA(Asn)/Glu-tRNA(Gln) amidotransferase A subunit family amidase
VELVGRPATELAAAVRGREVSAVDVVRAHLDEAAHLAAQLPLVRALLAAGGRASNFYVFVRAPPRVGKAGVA